MYCEIIERDCDQPNAGVCGKASKSWWTNVPCYQAVRFMLERHQQNVEEGFFTADSDRSSLKIGANPDGSLRGDEVLVYPGVQVVKEVRITKGRFKEVGV